MFKLMLFINKTESKETNPPRLACPLLANSWSCICFNAALYKVKTGIQFLETIMKTKVVVQFQLFLKYSLEKLTLQLLVKVHSTIFQLVCWSGTESNILRPL